MMVKFENSKERAMRLLDKGRCNKRNIVESFAASEQSYLFLVPVPFGFILAFVSEGYDNVETI